jgi:putative transposase
MREIRPSGSEGGARFIPCSYPIHFTRHSGEFHLIEVGFMIDGEQEDSILFRSMTSRRRQRLPHEIPLWVDPSKETYFITINCRERGRNQLAREEIAQPLFDTVRHRQEKYLWWPYLFLLMPDHLHALLSFPPSGKPLRLVISKWKEWTAKQLGLDWQDDFFEHRLRREESRREKAGYILANPVRPAWFRAPKTGPSFISARPEFTD